MFMIVNGWTVKGRDISVSESSFFDEKGFFFVVDYPLNYEYRKVIGLLT